MRSGPELQDRDIQILRGLFESRLMTLEHVTQLYFDGKSEAAKKRVQTLKAMQVIAERPRRPYHPSILHLTKRAFTLLSERGVLKEYPQLSWHQLEDRARVSDLTLRHELDVLDVKTALCKSVATRKEYELIEFGTWPRLYEFKAAQPSRQDGLRRADVVIRPDGFMRLHEHGDDEVAEYFFFLEVDRSNEPRQTLALRAFGYQDFYRRGGLALRYGYKAEDYKQFAFRVLMVFPNIERRNNMAERLLQNIPPIVGLVWLSTQPELIKNALGPIWIRPGDYREVTAGTAFDPAKRPTHVYRRQPEREALVERDIVKLSLFE